MSRAYSAALERLPAIVQAQVDDVMRQLAEAHGLPHRPLTPADILLRAAALVLAASAPADREVDARLLARRLQFHIDDVGVQPLARPLTETLQ